MQPTHQHRTVLLTLGRLPAGLDIARAFKARGWRVLVAEPMRWHLCRLSRSVDRSIQLPSPASDRKAYQNQLLRIVQQDHVDLVVPVLEDSFHVAGISDHLPLAVEPLATLHQYHDKWLFHNLAIGMELTVPETVLASDADGVAHLLACGDVIAKPRLSCSGAGVVVLSQHSELPRELAADQFIVQKRLMGNACCSLTMVVDGAIIETIVYQNLLESGTVGVVFRTIEVPVDVAHWIKAFCTLTKHNGWVAFDFIEDAGAWNAIECNPRATSGVHFMKQDTIVNGLTAVGAGEVLYSLPATAAGNTPEFKSQTGQLFWSALSSLYAHLFRRQPVGSILRSLVSVGDVSFSWRDPLPFLGLPIVMWPTIWRALRDGRPVEQVLVDDIQWKPALKSTPVDAASAWQLHE